MENEIIKKIFGDVELPKNYEEEVDFLNDKFNKNVINFDNGASYNYFTIETKLDDVHISIYITELNNGYYINQNAIGCVSTLKKGWHVEFCISKWDPKFYCYRNINEFETLGEIFSAVERGYYKI